MSEPEDIVTMSAIQSYLKTIVEQNSKTASTLKSLDKRVSSIEDCSEKPTTYLNNPKRKSISKSEAIQATASGSIDSESLVIVKGGPSKKLKVSDSNLALSALKPYTLPPSRNYSSPLPPTHSERDSYSGRNEEAQPGPTDSDSADSDISHYSSLSDHNNNSFHNEEEYNDDPTAANTFADTGKVSFPTLTASDNSTWKPSHDTVQWFSSIANIELDSNQLSSVNNDFQPPDDIAKIFEPPKVPKALWNRCKRSPSDTHNQRALTQIQDTVCSAIKPLLSVMESLNPTDPNLKKVASSIQLLAHANLKTSRVRRSFLSKHLRNDIKYDLLSQPITSSELFGDNFDTAVENAYKAKASTQKAVFIPKPQVKPVEIIPTPRNNPNQPGPSSYNHKPNESQPFRGPKSTNKRPSGNFSRNNRGRPYYNRRK